LDAFLAPVPVTVFRCLFLERSFSRQ